MPSSQFYNEDDAEQILKLAAAKQGIEGPLSHERLIETAAELGISPEAVEAAELEFRARKHQDEEMREFIKIQRQSFFGVLAVYVAVCGFFATRELLAHGHFGWTVWMIFGWGLGILAHGRSAFDRSSNDFQQAFDKWKARKDGSETGATATIGIHATIRRRRDR